LYKIGILITQSATYTPKSPKFPPAISGPVFPQFKKLQTLTFSHWIWKSKSSKLLEAKLLKLNLKWWGWEYGKKQLWKSSFIFKLQV